MGGKEGKKLFNLGNPCNGHEMKDKVKNNVKKAFESNFIHLHIDDADKHCLSLPFTCLRQLNGGSMGGGGPFLLMIRELENANCKN